MRGGSADEKEGERGGGRAQGGGSVKRQTIL